MYTTTFLLAAASILTLTTAQSTSTTPAVSVSSNGQPQAPTGSRGTITISSYSAHPPSYTPPHVNTATESISTLAGISAYSSGTSSVASSTYGVSTKYGSTTAPIVHASSSPASNYTLVGSATSVPSKTLASVSSARLGASSTSPLIPISSTNVGAYRTVAGTGLALVVAGCVLVVL